LDQRAKAAAPSQAEEEEQRRRKDGDVELLGEAVEALVMLEDQEEIDAASERQVEFTIHNRCRRLYSQGFREATGTSKSRRTHVLIKR
jgi:hypothetical protein